MIIQSSKQLRPRDEKDHYPTPRELCNAAINMIPEGEPYQYLTVLDPGAGAGVWGEAVMQRWGYADVYGVEMDSTREWHSDYSRWDVCDFLSLDYRPEFFDLVVGNPPYGRSADGKKDRKLAEKFVRKSFELVKPDGYIVFLLRLAFLEGQHRIANFWPDYPLKTIYVLSRRPSFTGDQRTDETAYGLFVWQKNYHGPTYQEFLVWDYENNRKKLRNV